MNKPEVFAVSKYSRQVTQKIKIKGMGKGDVGAWYNHPGSTSLSRLRVMVERAL